MAKGLAATTALFAALARQWWLCLEELQLHLGIAARLYLLLPWLLWH